MASHARPDPAAIIEQYRSHTLWKVADLYACRRNR